jgi:hypothetical protein
MWPSIVTEEALSLLALCLPICRVAELAEVVFVTSHLVCSCERLLHCVEGQPLPDQLKDRGSSWSFPAHLPLTLVITHEQAVQTAV